MSEVSELGVSTSAPEGYRLGDPIALEDLLALPPDGRRYVRDAEGRLALMAPDDAQWHGSPLSALVMWLARRVREPFFVTPERGIAFGHIQTLDGGLVPPSRLGPRTLEPDVAVFAARPGFARDERGRARGFDPSALRLVIEVLSPGTHREDLGLGAAADEVDRFRSYLRSGVPEFWILNPGPEALGLPPRTGLFLRAASPGATWEPIEGDEVVHAPGELHGLQPVAAGRLRSAALGLTFDLGALWTELVAPPG